MAKFDKPPETTRGKEQTPPAAPAAPAKPEAGKRPAELLREEKEKWKAEAESKSALLTANEAKIKEFEAKNKDTEALIARSAQLEKERDEARAEVRRAKKELDPEFMKKFQEPFDEVSYSTENLITQMDVTDTQTGEPRRGTKEDLDYLYGIDSPTKRNAEIRKMFGEDAITIIPKLDRMKELNHSFKRALAQEQARAAELDKQEHGQRVQTEAQIKEAYRKVNMELVETVPDYRDAPEDKEASEMRQKGYTIFDTAPANREQAVIKQAHVRQIVAAHFPLKLQNTRLKAQLEAAKAELAELKGADPNTPPKRKGDAPAASSDGLSWEEAARRELA